LQRKPESDRFETTQWTEVLLAGNPNQSGAKEALDRLCQKYWFPVYAVLRKRRSSHADAEDLTQAFFAEVLSNNKIAVADRSRGRFRWFLLTACNNFVANVHRNQNTLKRGGGKKHISINVDMESGLQRYEALEDQQWTAEQIFDRRWADWFEALEPFIAPGGDLPPHIQIAEELGASVGTVKTAIHRLRKRFGVALQEEVAETVHHRKDVKDELKILMDALTGV